MYYFMFSMLINTRINYYCYEALKHTFLNNPNASLTDVLYKVLFSHTLIICLKCATDGGILIYMHVESHRMVCEFTFNLL